MPEDSISNEKINSLVASNDPEDKIHFWQLYSVLGEDGMKKVITIFYMSVLNDTENAWFSEAFKEKSLKRHVRGQCEFWLDLMGGGVEYKKGLEGLECLHEASSEVMTSKGAKVWMDHLYKALDSFEYPDIRIKSTIVEFCLFLMTDYEEQFNFKHSNATPPKFSGGCPFHKSSRISNLSSNTCPFQKLIQKSKIRSRL